MLLVALLACIEGREHSIETVPEGSFDSVLLDVGSGDVELRASDDVRVLQTVRWAGQGSPPVIPAPFVEDGVLHVEGECPIETPFCTVDWKLALPTAVDVLAFLGSGDADLRHLTGKVEFSTGSGDITVADVAGELMLDSGSGDIVVTGASGPSVFAESGSGDVTVDIGDATSLLTLHTGSGDVSAGVADGAWALELVTGSGDVVSSGVTDDSGAERRIVAHTGSGDVTITGR